MTVDQNIAAHVAHMSDENYGKHDVICLIAGGVFSRVSLQSESSKRVGMFTAIQIFTVGSPDLSLET